MEYIKRELEQTILRTEKGFKAVLVTGPRQVGKSAILKHLHSERRYITFDDPVLLMETKREPGLFFRNNRPPVVLDEVQYIPELFSYIKMECDRSEDRGRIDLTASQHYHWMKNVSESLAGRVAVLEMAGLSLREIQGVDFSEPFVPTPEYIDAREKRYQPCGRIWEVIHRGSYPALADPEVDWQTFYSSYVQTYLDRDISDLGRIKDKLKFTQFMTVLAARTGQMLNYSSIASQIETTASTVRAWTSLLEASGLVYILQPYSSSVLNRAIRTPKLYFRDTGLVCFLAKYQTAETAMCGAMAGQLFETFVVSEILKSFSNAGRDYRMYLSYYRGKDRRESSENEIDLIIEENGMLYPVAIKMTANPKLKMTHTFDVLDRIPGKKRGTGVILCMYDSPLWLRENVVALPAAFI